MLLSVIVPVYNAGSYLKPCIESLLSLPFEKEIILVNDGSTDGAIEGLGMMDEGLRMRDERLGIRIIHQVNQGVSAARNKGLELATGEWVWFVDADDRVEWKDNCQLSILNSQLFCVLPFVWDENGRADHFEAHDGEIPYNLWRCWFKRDEIKKWGLHFTEGRKYAEDQEFILKYLSKTKAKTKAMEGPVYYYTVRPGSAMTRPGMKWKQTKDIAAVTGGFALCALQNGLLTQAWVWKQMKRLIKTLIVTIRR